MSYNDPSYSLHLLGQTIEENNRVKTIDRYDLEEMGLVDVTNR
jgi:hypothetical protein